MKLYQLNSERQWEDMGTGHVSSIFVESLDGISLVVKNESTQPLDTDLLLVSKIHPDKEYHKQQDTLILWTEPDQDIDLALSFQEQDGREEIWEKICEVQGKDPSMSMDTSMDTTEDYTQDTQPFIDENSESIPEVELPPVNTESLEEISNVVASYLSTPLRRERLALALEKNDYIKKLLSIFTVCKDLEDTSGLIHLNQSSEQNPSNISSRVHT